MTAAEQEYLKQIHHGTSGKIKKMHTKELASLVKAKPASVSDMIRKLAIKKLIIYHKYYGCSLSKKGLQEAMQVIRRHRLWELFLAEKLGLDWKEIHGIALQLQSITSKTLVEKLAIYLSHPAYDPHGEAIPDRKGRLPKTDHTQVYDLKINQPAKVFGYGDTGEAFLEYVEKLHLLIGTSVKILSIMEYDHSLKIQVGDKHHYIISKETAQKIFVTDNERGNSK
jgi:DtxR family Mn-dependent transcriptional regulator